MTHVHEFQYEGSGTNFEEADIGYRCECGAYLTIYISLEDYQNDLYPKKLRTTGTEISMALKN